MLPKMSNFQMGGINVQSKSLETIIGYVDHVILPYVKKTQQELGLSSTYPALALFDCFKGQCVESVFQKVDENNILCISVLPNNQ